MGIVETPESAPEQSQPAQEAPAQESAPQGDIPTLQGQVASLEAKLKSLEEAAIKAVHDRLYAIESLLKSKYPHNHNL